MRSRSVSLSVPFLALAAALAAPAAAGPGTVGPLAWPSAQGWPVRAWHPRKTATLADLDGDGRLEILFVGTSEKDPASVLAVVLRGNGSALRGWPQRTGMAGPSGPVVGDVDGDGKPEVVVTDGARVAVWDARGKPRHPAPAPIPGASHTLHENSEAALADVDGDGRLELVFVVWGPQVFAVRLAGAPEHLAGFPLALEGVFGASPAVGDLDGDGRDDVVIANESGSCYFIRWRPDGVEASRARDAAGVPIAISSRSSAAIADLEGDGTPSVALGSYEGNLFVFDAGGAERWRHRVTAARRGHATNIHSSPALVDLDGDGRREVVFAAYDGRVRALASGGELRHGWEGAMLENGRGGVVAGDIDGEAGLEVLVADAAGAVFVFHADGAPAGYLPGPSWNPLLGDVDGDGHLEVVLPIGRVGVDVLEPPGRPKAPAAWPMHRFDARHSGSAMPARAAAAPPR